MNPLTDALKLAEDSSSAPVGRTADRWCDSAIQGSGQFDSIGETADDPVRDALSPANSDVGKPSGAESPIGWLKPIRATRDDGDTDLAALDIGFAATKEPASARSSPSDAPTESAGGHPSEARAARSAPHRGFDPRTLPRGRSIGRLVGTAALSLLAVIGAAVGGYFLWETELVRPALVRRVHPVPVPVMDLAPVHTANAAVNGGGEPADGASPRTDERPVVLTQVPEAPSSGAPSSQGSSAGLSASGAPDEPRVIAAAGAPTRGDTARPRAVSLAGAPTSQTPLAPRAIPATESATTQRVEPARSDRAPTPASIAGTPTSQTPLAPRAIPATESATTQRVEPARSDRAPTPASIAGTPTSQTPLAPRAIPATESATPERVEPARNDRAPTPASSASSAGHSDRARPRHRNPVSASGEPAPEIQPSAQAAAGAFPGAVDHPAPVLQHDEAEPRPGSGAGIAITNRVRADHVAASLLRAYEAFLAGDGESAAQAYRAVLGHEPGNRDARLGIAALAARAGRWDEAAAHYARVLASHPADTVARAALIALDEQDPTRGESRLKVLLHSEPQAAHLHFNLGNLYAAQSRWPEAQHSYFSAYRFDRGNADYAYNLAVSLDHLSQSRSALGLYREALVLSRSRPANFETAAVRHRIRDLATRAEAASTTAGSVPEAAVAAPAASVQ